MTNAEFLSKKSIYGGDYLGIMRDPSNEFNHGLHYHDFYEFCIYLGDAGVFHIDEKEYSVQRGDLVLIDIFKPHMLLHHKISSYQRFSINVDLKLVIAFSTPHSNLLDVFRRCSRHPIHHLEEDQFSRYILLLEEYQKLQLNKGQDILEKALIHQLLAYAYNDCYFPEPVEETESQHMRIIAELLDYIDAHLSEEMPLSDLAATISYSEYYVCRIFKRITGKTLTGYIQEKRIEQAAWLLRSCNSVNQVAEQVGFNNYSYFYKTFKKFMGCGPAEYQATRRNPAQL